MASLLDPSARGRVILVGAGPGDPGLLTVRAVEALRQADVLVHDGLVDPRVLDLAPRAHRISVAKTRSKHTVPQDAINALIIAHVKTGAIVVRLKGGDPFIFGRGGEEVEAVRAAGLPVEVIPGISAALGAAAEFNLPLTHRDWSSASRVRSARDPSSVPRSSTATGMSGVTPSAISLSAISGHVATPI